MKSLKALSIAALIGLNASFLVGFSTPAQAAMTAAMCWSESGLEVVDGEFIVTIDTDKLTKAALVKTLDRLNGVLIHAKLYPMIFGKVMIVHIAAADQSASRTSQTREEFKAAVESELKKAIGSAKGVSVDCNVKSTLQPAVGFRN